MPLADAGVPGVDQLTQIASLGGFAFMAIVLVAILFVLFRAFTSGDLISRAAHEAAVKQLTDANAALRTDLRTSVGETGRLAEAVEKLGDLLTTHDRDLRERVAGVAGSVQTLMDRRRG